MSGYDRGESLLELLISVTILGIGVVALLSGMGAAALTSGLHRQQAVSATAVRAAAEALQADTVAYAPCATTYAVPGYNGPPVTVQVDRYWRAGQWQTGCSAHADDHGAQQVRLTLAPPDPRVRAETLVVVKRKPCGPADPAC